MRYTCQWCGHAGDDQDDFHVGYNGYVVCLGCRVKMLKSFLSFLLFWKNKMTSDHGKQYYELSKKDTEEQLVKAQDELRRKQYEKQTYSNRHKRR